MKFWLAAAAAVCGANLPLTATAQDWYARADGSVVAGSMDVDLFPFGAPVTGAPDAINVDLGPGVQLTAAAGIELENGFSVEGQAVYVRSQLDGIDAGPDLDVYTSLTGGMLRGIYVVERAGLKPYIAAGAGYGTAQVGSTDGTVGSALTGNGAMWSADIGAEYPLSGQASLTAGYGFLGGDFDIYQPEIHRLFVGVKVRFK
jgi:hypothetical protein